jgi:hypothetical protein
VDERGAVIGAGVMLVRNRRALIVLAIAFAPYAVFHLIYQETITVRYALPLVVPIAYALPACSRCSGGSPRSRRRSSWHLR